MYVVINQTHLRTEVYGPFQTAARASGEGLNLFGPWFFGTPNRWSVVKMARKTVKL